MGPRRASILALCLLLACVTGEPSTTAGAVDPASSARTVDATPAEGRAQAKAQVRSGSEVVEVDGHPLTVWYRQPERARDVIVLVHGRTWSARPDFDLQAPGEQRSLMDALVAEGFAVYAVDLRGYGATPRDATGWLTPDRAAADVAEVLAWVRGRHPDGEPPVLLGWSLGSIISQLTAQRHPERLSALVLFGYPRDPDQRYPPGPDPSSEPPRKATTAEAAAEDFIIPGSISQAGIDAFVEAALASDPVRTDWTGTEQWNALDPAAVTVPTLLLQGERDPYAPIDDQAKLFTRLANPDREWVVIAGGDHAAHLEDCGPRFVHALVEFVRRPR
ncbi:MAG: alpha/beta fold hydrolase [Myxococcales bacterium]|nr:alpha/beta fold hydrolase [Myxococcales bacterium]